MFTESKAKAAGYNPARKMSPNFPVEYYILAGLEFRGAILGYLSDKPIRESAVDDDGQSYRFAGVATRDANGRYDVFCLEPDEWIVEPGLIYVADLSDGDDLRYRNTRQDRPGAVR